MGKGFPNFPAMNREKVDAGWERLVFWLVLGLLVYAPMATGAVRQFDFAMVTGLAAVALGAWAVRLSLQAKPAFLWPVACWGVVAFLAYAAWRCPTAEVGWYGQRELLRVLVYGAVFFLVLNNLQRPNLQHGLAYGLLAVGTAAASYAVYQYATQTPFVWGFLKPGLYLHRSGGPFINPNHLAGFLSLLLPVGLGYVVLGRISHAWRIIFGYACLVMLGGIAVTHSRAGWIVTGITLFLFVIFLLKYREFRLPAVLMLMLLTVVGTGVGWEVMKARNRFTENFQNGQIQDPRLFFWSAALGMAKEHPVTGVGPGHYDLHWPQHRPPLWRAQLRPIYAHNDYLNTLADWGAAGLLLVFAFAGGLAWGIGQSWRAVRRELAETDRRRSNKQALLYGASFGLVALALHSLLEFNFQIPGIALAAVSLMALLAAQTRWTKEACWLRTPRWGAVLVALLLVGSAAWFGHRASLSFQENAALQAAQKAGLPADKMAAWKEAWTINPANAETAFKIGETLRGLSWQGNDDYEKLALEAILWMERAEKLNPYEPRFPIQHGMCLDWIGRHAEALTFFEKALALDPNGYKTVNYYGWHFIQTGDYARAKSVFDHSIDLYDNTGGKNRMAGEYGQIAERKLREPADGLPVP